MILMGTPWGPRSPGPPGTRTSGTWALGAPWSPSGPPPPLSPTKPFELIKDCCGFPRHFDYPKVISWL